ncbi:hypothetical protein PbJCM13498_00760 [Prolixibacter bellariivorans]|uniref:HTH marR-type domain-containing protein n=1 Tax=Prolixibacter bellariivorans TaxID=314319 RepID=A0A5M4AU87_9BACT|nr:MarR family transcriptional regulator [Prolixibacter bellariivorans]GET31213.1 hypothetical protein PbJCM13498_00760 [Prolixibacter bellariivorans]
MENGNGIMFMIYELRRKCASVDQRLMDDLGLSQSELLFFSALDNCEKISSPELAKNMDLSPSRVSRVVDKLVNNDFLIREVDPNDRRAITLNLTEKGKKVKEQIDMGRQECEAQLMEIMPDTDMKRFSELVTKIVTTLK